METITEKQFNDMLTGAEKVNLRNVYPWAKRDDGKMSRHARAAANMRKELRLAFPGIKFQVQAQAYSMGTSIHVHWELGPTEKQVREITSKYQYGWFDGMVDLYEYDHSPESTAVGEILGQVKHVIEQRRIPDGWLDAIARDLCKLQGIEYAGPYTMHLMGDRDPDPVDRHAMHHVWNQSFPPGAKYRGVRFVTAQEWEQAPAGIFAVIETDN